MEIDYAKLLNIGKNKATEGKISDENEKVIQYHSEKEKTSESTSESHLYPQKEKRCYTSLEHAKNEIEWQRKSLKDLENRVEKSATMRTQILKGIDQGTAPELLLLKAIECISFISGDTAFKKTAEEGLLKVQGEIFHNKEYLEVEIKDTRERLNTLELALKTEMDKTVSKRVKKSIKEHEERIKALEEKLNN